MSISYNDLAAVFILLPLLLACTLPFISRLFRALVPVAVLAANLLLLVLSVAFVFHLGGQDSAIFEMLGMEIYLDSLSALIMVVISSVSVAVSIYAASYMDRYAGKTKFYILLLLMLGGMYGLVMSVGLFTMYVYFEVAAISSYILVAFSLKWDGLEAAFKYAILSAISTLMILFASGLLFYQYGTLDLVELSYLIPASSFSAMNMLAGGLLLCGFGFKAAMIPFHVWLPDAHASAPAPVSAMLSGVLIKVLGVYAVVRIVYSVFGAPAAMLDLIAAFGGLSLIIGVILALKQWDFKRLLAYHSVSQVGYILLGIGLGTPLGIAGGLFHLLNHALFKGLLFLNAGAVESRLGTRQLKEMGGLENRMPVTATTSVVASLSIAGIPPFNGFWSKFLIIFAAILAKAWLLAGLAVLGSLLTLASFMKVQKYAFFGKLNEKWNEIKEVHWTMGAGMVYLAILCFAVGIGFFYVLDHFITPAVNVLVG